MDFYAIPPLNNLDLMHKGDRYFCLAQLYIEHQHYRDFFKSLPDTAWVTLDNGAGDHDLVTEDILFEVMRDLMPSEVIPPDILFNADQTIINAKRFHRRMCEEGLCDDIEVFFCPQGKNQKDWLECYHWGLHTSWVKTLGMSKIGVPKAWVGSINDRGIMEGRINAFNYLRVNEMLNKPLHFLGMGDPREYAYYKQFSEFDCVRSSDSCNSIWSAMNSINWADGEFVRIPTPKDYFNREIPKDLVIEHIIKTNINYLKLSVR